MKSEYNYKSRLISSRRLAHIFTITNPEVCSFCTLWILCFSKKHNCHCFDIFLGLLRNGYLLYWLCFVNSGVNFIFCIFIGTVIFLFFIQFFFKYIHVRISSYYLITDLFSLTVYLTQSINFLYVQYKYNVLQNFLH